MAYLMRHCDECGGPLHVDLLNAALVHQAIRRERDGRRAALRNGVKLTALNARLRTARWIRDHRVEPPTPGLDESEF